MEDLYYEDIDEIPLRKNYNKGKAGEKKVKLRYELEGYWVERTGRGSDFRVERRNYLTGCKESKLVEVKTGNARLSPLQRKTKRKHRNYVVETVDPVEYVEF